MEFPLKSLGAFGAAFCITNLLCDWFRIYVLGWYETKWSADFNFAIDIVAFVAVFTPITMLAFALGSYLVNTERDPWLRSLIGGMLFAVALLAATRFVLWIESTFLANALIWSLLLLGPGGVGVWTRFSVRRMDA